MTNEVLRTLLILSATGAVLTIAVYALSPLSALLPEKAVLDRRCNLRFDIMTASGALEEVAGLLARQVPESLPVMKAKGVPELAAYLRGETGFEEAAENAKLHTRQYAKRQLTWFRNKLEADVTLPDCYAGQADFINDVKKQYNMLQKFA